VVGLPGARTPKVSLFCYFFTGWGTRGTSFPLYVRCLFFLLLYAFFALGKPDRWSLFVLGPPPPQTPQPQPPQPALFLPSRAVPLHLRRSFPFPFQKILNALEWAFPVSMSLSGSFFFFRERTMGLFRFTAFLPLYKNFVVFPPLRESARRRV